MNKEAYVAGGCFWGMEELFRAQPGVIDTEVGYTGGTNSHPTYENHPGHAEALKIVYDDTKTDYDHLLDFFFRIHDPTTLNRQGNDVGDSYRSALFPNGEDELIQTKAFIARVNASGRWKHPVVTSVEPLVAFYPAEAYHQDYLQKQPDGYTCHFIRLDSYLDEKPFNR